MCSHKSQQLGSSLCSLSCMTNQVLNRCLVNWVTCMTERRTINMIRLLCANPFLQASLFGNTTHFFAPLLESDGLLFRDAQILSYFLGVGDSTIDAPEQWFQCPENQAPVGISAASLCYGITAFQVRSLPARVAKNVIDLGLRI